VPGSDTRLAHENGTTKTRQQLFSGQARLSIPKIPFTQPPSGYLDQTNRGFLTYGLLSMPCSSAALRTVW